MKRIIPFIMILVLISSCATPAASPATSTASIPSATPDPLLEVVQEAMLGLVPGDIQPLDQAEQAVTDLLREASGARAALGDQADAFFLSIDQAKIAAVQELVNKAGGTTSFTPAADQTRPLTLLEKMLGVTSLISMNYQIASWGMSLGMLAGTPLLMDNAPRDAAGNTSVPKLEVVTTTKDDVAIYLSLTPKMVGSRMESDVEMIISTTTPVVYEETTKGKLSMELCPDAQGDVPLTFSFESSSSMNSGGIQMAAKTQATGHVDDEAKLTSYDLQTTSSGASQPGVGAKNGATNQFIEANLNIHGSLTDPNATSMTGDFTRASSQTDYKYATSMTNILAVLNAVMTSISLMIAEMKWTQGYCVEIRVPELGAGEKKVDPNSDTPFTATVWHKFEGVELQVPVIATLSDGQVSVSPSGSKVQAPASFTYKAPAEKDKSATVKLETRSKRGAAALDVKFKTKGAASFTGEGTYRKSMLSSGFQVVFAYTFSITFHALPDGTIEGTGTLTKTEASNAGQGMLVCKDIGTSALSYPPLQVTGTFTPAATGQTDGKFQLNIVNQPSTNTWQWKCSMAYADINIGTKVLDEGVDVGPGAMHFDIPAIDGAQANGTKDTSSGGGTGSATSELKIHMQAAP